MWSHERSHDHTYPAATRKRLMSITGHLVSYITQKKHGLSLVQNVRRRIVNERLSPLAKHRDRKREAQFATLVLSDRVRLGLLYSSPVITIATAHT
jgi:predicted aminopeptidase